MKQHILVVEDNTIIAEDIIEILREIGFSNIYKSHCKPDAEELLNNFPFDLALIDINLQNTLEGIHLGKKIDQKHQIPYLYLTSYSDDLTISKVKETKPSGYVLKPFSKETLKVNLLLALNQKNHPEKSIIAEKNLNENLLTIKDGYDFVKLKIDEILWIEADKNYIHIKLQNKKITLRESLRSFRSKLPDYFEFSHKKYVVNVKAVNRYNTNEVLIYDQKLPIGRNFQDIISKKLNLFT